MEKVKLICKECGTEFERYRCQIRKGKEGDFCSVRCWKAWRQKQVVHLNCKVCGDRFNVRKSAFNHRSPQFCSNKCRNKYLKGKPKPRKTPMAKLICEQCGKEFERPESHVRSRERQGCRHTYCSKNCRDIHRKENPEELRERTNYYSGTLYKCDQCGIEMMVPSYRMRASKRHFCSKECLTNYHREHPEISGTYKPDRNSLKTPLHETIRKSLKMQDWRIKIFQRDNYICQMCGDTNGLGHTVRLEAHHIKRFTDFPKLRTDLKNGICLCTKCHDKTKGKETEYEDLFNSIVSSKMQPPVGGFSISNEQREAHC